LIEAARGRLAASEAGNLLDRHVRRQTAATQGIRSSRGVHIFRIEASDQIRLGIHTAAVLRDISGEGSGSERAIAAMSRGRYWCWKVSSVCPGRFM
jgi:hypothetical protein